MRVMTARSAKSDNLRYAYCVFQYGANGETVDTREASRPEVRIL